MIPRYSRVEMARLFTDEAKLALWLRVEIQALKSRAACGELDSSIPSLIEKKARVTWPRVLELEKELKHDVLAFLTALNESLGEEARHVHFGMTSNDLLDSALALQCVQALELIESDLRGCLSAFRDQALRYRKLLGVGRSHGVHGEPVIFGLKFLLWYADFSRLLKHLESAREAIAVGKYSGAMGTAVHVPLEVEEHFCEALGLKAEPIATQVVQRDRHAHLMNVLALIGASIEKVAVELRHLQRTEVLEVEESFGRGQKGSSAMPHKKNPISAENLTGCARMLKSYAVAALDNVALWHERDISHSSVERVFLSDAFIICDYALHRLQNLVSGLVVHEDRVEKNLNLTRGLVFSQNVLLALIEAGMAREEAYALIQKQAHRVWNDEKLTLQSALSAEKSVRKFLSEEKLKKAFSPTVFTRSIDGLYQRVLKSYPPPSSGGNKLSRQIRHKATQQARRKGAARS